MKSITYFLFLAVLFMTIQTADAQAPQLFNYQAVARSSNGDVLGNKQVALRLSLREGSAGGTILYQEIHAVQTNGLGLFSVHIGGGAVQTGSMASVNWVSGGKYLQVELDPDGGSSYIDLGASQLLSVPYALHAASGGTVYLAGQGIQINGQTITNTGDLNANDDLLVTTNFNGDVTGVYTNIQIKPNTIGSEEIINQSIIGEDISPMGAVNGEVLKWNGSQWAPAMDLMGSGSFVAGSGINITGNTISALHDNVLWNALKLYGRNISATMPTNGQVLKWDGNLWSPADDETGGGGSYQAGSGISIVGNTITALSNEPIWNAASLQGRFVAETLPSNGQALVWNNSNARWEPQTLSGSGLGGSGTGNYLAKFVGTNLLGNAILYESSNGIGLSTTNPDGKFHIQGTQNQTQLVVQAYSPQSNTQPLILAQASDGSELFRIHSDHYHNLFIGRLAGDQNQVIPTTAGEFNTFIGGQSGELNVGGGNNSAIGFKSLNVNVNGFNNSVLGAFALSNNTSGSYNTALGAFSQQMNLTGQFNTSLGTSSMNSNTVGSFNTAIGSSALNGNDSGSGNTALGHRSMFSSITGIRNVAIGQDAMFNASIANYNVAIGAHALFYNSNRNYIVAIGDSALYSNSFGAVDPSQGKANTAVGSKALMENTTGSDNTAIGFQSMASATIGSRNTAVGYQSLQFNQLGEENTALGYRAMFQNNLGLNNTAVGMEALFSNYSGHRNTAVGNKSLVNNTEGMQNTAVGDNTLESNQTGTNNVAVGVMALQGNNAANYSTAVGAYALDFSNTQGNTALGYMAGSEYVQGPGNTYVGYNAKTNLSGHSNSTALGAEVTITGSNMVRIGNSAVTSIGGYANWSNVSDGRIKTQIQENVRGLDFIMKLRPVTYNLDMDAIAQIIGSARPQLADATEKESSRQTGFIAQEVETAAKSSGFAFSGVDTPENGQDLYGLRYAEFVVPLVKAMQEQQALIQAQQEMIQALKADLEALKADLQKK